MDSEALDAGRSEGIQRAGSEWPAEIRSEEVLGHRGSVDDGLWQPRHGTPSHRNDTPAKTSTWVVEYDDHDESLEEFMHSQRRESPTRTFSPVLGAMQHCTLECASPSILAQTIDTKLNLTFPKYSKPFDVTSRLRLFFEKPIIFHGFTVASAVHRDILRNEPALSRDQEIIVHHSKLLRLLHDLLNNLDDADIELAVLAILLLTLADLDCFQLGRDSIIPFIPHMASANWINVFGRVMSLDNSRFNEHVRAMETLSMRRGGIQQLQLPGLGVQVA